MEIEKSEPMPVSFNPVDETARKMLDWPDKIMAKGNEYQILIDKNAKQPELYLGRVLEALDPNVYVIDTENTDVKGNVIATYWHKKTGIGKQFVFLQKEVANPKTGSHETAHRIYYRDIKAERSTDVII